MASNGWTNQDASYTYIRVYMHTCMYTYIRIYVYTYIHMYICTDVHLHAYIPYIQMQVFFECERASVRARETLDPKT
jgi:hypothetical protein